jgi:hypothetical protein
LGLMFNVAVWGFGERPGLIAVEAHSGVQALTVAMQDFVREPVCILYGIDPEGGPTLCNTKMWTKMQVVNDRAERGYPGRG